MGLWQEQGPPRRGGGGRRRPPRPGPVRGPEGSATGTTAKGDVMRAGKMLAAAALSLLLGGAQPFGVAHPRRVLVKAALASLALAAALLGGLAPAAHAGLILQPASASTDM